MKLSSFQKARIIYYISVIIFLPIVVIYPFKYYDPSNSLTIIIFIFALIHVMMSPFILWLVHLAKVVNRHAEKMEMSGTWNEHYSLMIKIGKRILLISSIGVIYYFIANFLLENYFCLPFWPYAPIVVSPLIITAFIDGYYAFKFYFHLKNSI